LPIQRHIGLWLGAALTITTLAAVAATAEPAPRGGDAVRLLAQVSPPQEPKGGVQVAPQAGGDAALRQRVEQLEEQLVDMQVVVGTLESLARGGGSAAPAAPGGAPAAYGAADDLRIDGLETQVRALAAQIEQLTAQVKALAGEPRRADAEEAPMDPSAPGELASSPPPASATPSSSPSPTPGLGLRPGDPGSDRFGSTTVSAGTTAGTKDAIGGLIDNETPAPDLPGEADTEVAATPPAFMPPPAASDAGNPKQLYETAYGYLMQRDYGAAQGAFEDFLSRYPNDSLAGNAQYWLGEAHFVRGEYKAAAGAFLKGYQNYAGNARAADSLLKLAMSLDRLGQKDAACTSFAELSSRFPDAPENVKTRAKSERQRIGCP